MDVLPAFWDDELEQLASKVHELFGDRTLDICVERATALTFGASARDVSASRADDPLVLPSDVFRDALKAELKRRLLPN